MRATSTQKDLNFAKTARVNSFPSMFSTGVGNIQNFARLESTAGRWTTTRPT